jgi:hypothetical protein
MLAVVLNQVPLLPSIPGVPAGSFRRVCLLEQGVFYKNALFIRFFDPYPMSFHLNFALIKEG